MMTGLLHNFVRRFSRRFPAEPWQCLDLRPAPEGVNLARMEATVKAAFAEILGMMVSAFSSQPGPAPRLLAPPSPRLPRLTKGQLSR